MKYLPINLLFLTLFSCSIATTKDLIKSSITEDVVINDYFSDTEKDYIYKAKIEVYNHNFGGILIIKKLASNNHRVVFTTEFGNKLFDFLYDGIAFEKKYVVEEMDKRMIVNTLQKDFRILISEKNKVIEQYQNSKFTVYKTRNEGRNNYYFINKKTHILDKIVNTSKSREKLEIWFEEINDNNADLIKIKHKNIKLSIRLEKFKNN